MDGTVKLETFIVFIFFPPLGLVFGGVEIYLPWLIQQKSQRIQIKNLHYFNSSDISFKGED